MGYNVSFQFVLAVGLDKKKFHLVGLSMGGFVAGVFASQYSSLLSSLVLMCPAGINAPKMSDFINNIANGGKNYLLPDNPQDFQYMIKKVSHRKIFIPFFIAKIMSAARSQSNSFYEKGNSDNYFENLKKSCSGIFRFPLTFYTQMSVCIFPILFSIHFLTL